MNEDGEAAIAGGEDAAPGQGVSAPDASAAHETAPSGETQTGGVVSSLLTREDSGGEATGQARSGEGEGRPEDAAASVPAKPEDYQIAFADGVTVDEGLLGNFKAAAHELGIPQGQAQKLADFYVKNVGDSAKAAQEAQASSLLEAKKGWESEIEARPGFRQELVDAKRALKEFGSPELNQLMDQSYLGSHPVFFDFVVKAGKALAEPEGRGRGAGGGREKPLMDRLWPDKE